MSPHERPDLRSADLDGAELSAANLEGVTLVDAKLRAANLVGARLNCANLGNAKLGKAVLRQADLTNADLVRSNLSEADLTEATLTGANLRRANLTAGNLMTAKLVGANLSRARLGKAVLANAEVGWTTFGDTDLTEVIGLRLVRHVGPSTIGVDTLYRTRGADADHFLLAAGVPDGLLRYIRSLPSEALQFHSCFVSFAEPDDEFSRTLSDDLRAASVRCWRWKEDAKWGASLIGSIDEAIQTYDKLVVVCSLHSLQSPAVLREIERALQKEDQLARRGTRMDVLFPIRVDDYVFDSWVHPRRADVVAKNVGDFRQWRIRDEYQRAVQRLVLDLKRSG